MGYVITRFTNVLMETLTLPEKYGEFCIELRWSWHLVKKGWISTRQCKLSALIIILIKLHLGNNME